MALTTSLLHSYKGSQLVFHQQFLYGKLLIFYFTLTFTTFRSLRPINYQIFFIFLGIVS